MSTVTRNLDFGPWDGSAWFQQQREAAVELSATVRPDDALLVHLWPLTAADLQISGDSVQMRQEYLAALPAMEFLRRKGPPSVRDEIARRLRLAESMRARGGGVAIVAAGGS